MIKRPSFQFYPSDWLRDTALRSCSMGARGLWMDMICYMHEGNPYGHLKVGDKVILPDNLARMVGENLSNVEGWLYELNEAGVYDLIDGVIVSRRMVKDENIRNIRALGGKLGGNPALKAKDKVNLKVENKDKQKSTPSSSSSSSSSNINIELPDWLPEVHWKDFVEFRKFIKKPMTAKAMQLMISKLERFKDAGHNPIEALNRSIANNWSDVYEPKPDTASKSKSTPHLKYWEKGYQP